MPNDGGPAFGSFKKLGAVATSEGGLTVRDWFATFSPEPTVEQIGAEGERDRQANPHNDSYKPKRRSKAEIVAGLRYAWADAMIAERERRTKADGT